VSILEAIILGIAQGLAEFMPISSSGHLILIPWLFGWEHFDDESLKKASDVALHLGTLTGAVFYFRSDIHRLVRAAILDPKRKDGRLAWLIAISAIPAAITGALVADTVERNTQQVWLIAVMLIVGALGLAWADGVRGKRTIDDVGLRDAIIIGCAQALALQPGVSRAGVTITAGRFLGLGRDGAVRFAFLMSLPIVAGALVFKYVDIGGWGAIPSDVRGALVWGMAASAVTGYLAVWGVLRLVRTRSFAPFVLYRLILAVFILGVLATPWR
jgi:undecaprenyl-diphosphatase